MPSLSGDPDARLVRWGWIAWTGLTAYVAARWLGFDRGGADAWTWLQLGSAVVPWTLWPAVRGGIALWRWLRGAPVAASNGSYFEFDGKRVRVLFDDDALYLVAADVFEALELRGSATAPDRVRLAAGRDGLRSLPHRRELVFTERGLNAWLERRSGDQAVKFRRWFDREVVTPLRRRRQL